MIDYLRRVFTGYRRVNKVVDGQTVTFDYVGQLVGFSPLTMLRGLKVKVTTERFSEVSDVLQLTEVLSRLMSASSLPPAKVKATMKLGKNQIKAFRYVTKLEQYSISYYEFYCDEKVVAILYRKYDYGRSFASTVLALVPKLSEATIQTDKSYLIRDKDSGAQMLIDVFGHTQVWLMPDLNGFMELIQGWEGHQSNAKEAL
ncbi:hypothetical protein LZF95_03485 [Algoriphagus sp. AGSA1]|uniref:hypothetical protein n=1 Tax=Algoriphagus sp. AGSA1 TaxID=2907213 RepID=UPI001F2B24E6|nr:hypothetical protein [Algoriphagus sp. AGSA1]MCE7053727.1 hypothetical protein [Algoriphagus sp. AGSA1]